MEEVLPDTLPMERIPGTEIMRDVGKIHFVHGPKSHQVYVCPSPIPVYTVLRPGHMMVTGFSLQLYANRLTIDRSS
jgi:diadenosine tetraphosphatase ApaH/serine/threonine PP2A family protein phosphatase